MALTPEVILEQVLIYLPNENVLTDNQIEAIAESVILKVGDDDSKMDEVVCKTLRISGIANKTKSSISGGSVRREKSRNREVEFFDHSAEELWDSFLNSLAELCPLLPNGGYSFPRENAFGFYGRVSPKVKATKPCRPGRGCGR